MKSLYALLLAVCFSLTAYAQVQVDEVSFESDWPLEFLLATPEINCPGGTLALNMGVPYCDSASGQMLVRGSEIYSCLGNSFPFDPRVEGTVWIEINANWDANYTGPGWGRFILVPGEACDAGSLINPEVYWKGSWQGRREIVSDTPMTWVHTIQVLGHGVGGELEGLKMRGTEVLTLFTPMAVSYEYLCLMGYPCPTGPESFAVAEIKSKD